MKGVDSRPFPCHKKVMLKIDDSLAGAVNRMAGGNSRLLLLCDHASNRLPPGMTLGVPAAIMDEHIAYDVGAAALTAALAAHFDAPAILGGWSRLLVDLNRPPQQAIATRSDGVVIPANVGLDAAARHWRLAAHAAFHDAIDAHIAACPPALIVAVHSFTPALAAAPAARPWPIALLWNQDDRATIPALAALRTEVPGGPVGANEPYSGKVLNYTMDRHAEANGIAYLGFEVRQDQLADSAGVAHYAAIMARAIAAAMQAAPWGC